MLTSIDHVTFAVRDLDAAVAHFRNRFSLVVSKVRVDKESHVANAVIPLLQGYIEILAPVGAKTSERSPFSRQLGGFLDAQQGLFGYAIRSTAINHDVASLRERGSTLDEPRHEHAEGSDDPGWWTAYPSGQAGVVEPYVINHDIANEDAIRQAALAQPFAVRSIEEVAIVVPNVEDTLTVYDRDFDLKPVRQFGGRAQLALAGNRIMVLPSAMMPLGTPLGLYSVSLGTTDISRARDNLRDRSIAFADDPYTWAVASQLDPADTFGSRIDLVQL
jgi:catechol 2,3-dioxygenase-like lactoylglutathione lyase family enzyme